MEHYLRARITLSAPASSTTRREIGPVNMDFEIPQYSCSTVQIRYLRVVERTKSFSPSRWVRYITHSNSYVCRMTS